MYVFEYLKPGTWLDYQDVDWVRNIESHLSALESHFVRANESLNMFEEERRRDSAEEESILARAALAGIPTRTELLFEERRQRVIQAEESLRTELGIAKHHPASHTEDFRLEVDLRVRRAEYACGIRPRSLAHQRPFISAQAFVFALDNFGGQLAVLAKACADVVPDVCVAHEDFKAAFPTLRPLRNAAHHPEDYGRGIARDRGKLVDIPLQAVSNQLFKFPKGTLLVQSSLYGSKYGGTMADGHYGEIDVSPASMEILHSILVRVLRAFRWKGPKSNQP